MSVYKRSLAVAVIISAASIGTAFAHDDAPITRHERDHIAHRQADQRLYRAHERAHDEGFDSRAEHRGYHRELRREHNEIHEDLPNTRHSNYSWRRSW